MYTQATRARYSTLGTPSLHHHRPVPLSIIATAVHRQKRTSCQRPPSLSLGKGVLRVNPAQSCYCSSREDDGKPGCRRSKNGC